MKFDTIIIGGGLSGLTTGISLAKAGQKVAIVSSGQSTLHFHSGSFDLLGYNNSKEVLTPLEELKRLDANHPYSKISDVATLAEEAIGMLRESNVKIKGETSRNHYRLTPMGVLKPTWLTMDEFFISDSAETLPYKKFLLVNFAGFFDFPVEFIADGLEKLGARVNVKGLRVPMLQERRLSPSEMRSANIAKLLSDENVVELISQKINTSIGDAEVVLLPSVVGLCSDEMIELLRSKVSVPLFMVATLPPSVSGVRVQNALSSRFKKLGGSFLLGATVFDGVISNNKVESIKISTLPDEVFVANNYVLATGSFQSHGLVANYSRVYEPVFELDVEFDEQRSEWTRHNVFESQPYMTFGVKTDNCLRALKDGVSVSNLYVAGSVLAGHDSVKLSDAAGVSIITGLAVSKSILKQK